MLSDRPVREYRSTAIEVSCPLASSIYEWETREEFPPGGGGGMSADVYLSLLCLALDLIQKQTCFWFHHVKPSRGLC